MLSLYRIELGAGSGLVGYVTPFFSLNTSLSAPLSRAPLHRELLLPTSPNQLFIYPQPLPRPPLPLSKSPRHRSAAYTSNAPIQPRAQRAPFPRLPLCALVGRERKPPSLHPGRSPRSGLRVFRAVVPAAP